MLEVVILTNAIITLILYVLAGLYDWFEDEDEAILLLAWPLFVVLALASIPFWLVRQIRFPLPRRRVDTYPHENI